MPSPDHEPGQEPDQSPEIAADSAGQPASGPSDHTTHIPILDADTEEMSQADVSALGAFQAEVIDKVGALVGRLSYGATRDGAAAH